MPLSGVISRKFVWICLTKLERRDISQIFYFSMENFFYFGETCLQLIALGVIGVKCEFDKKTRKELPDTFLWLLSGRFHIEGAAFVFSKQNKSPLKGSKIKVFFDIFPENVNKMPPKEIREETAMSAKLFLENVMDFNLYEDCKTADVPWQAVIEGVSLWILKNQSSENE